MQCRTRSSPAIESQEFEQGSAISIVGNDGSGKTTLVDRIIDQCKVLDEKESTELLLDSNDLERERGITIFSKNVAVTYKDEED